MSVRNGFTIEIYGSTHSLHTFLTRAAQMYGFTHSLRTFWVCAAYGAIRWRTRRIEDDGRLENASRKIEDG